MAACLAFGAGGMFLASNFRFRVEEVADPVPVPVAVAAPAASPPDPALRPGAVTTRPGPHAVADGAVVPAGAAADPGPAPKSVRVERVKDGEFNWSPRLPGGVYLSTNAPQFVLSPELDENEATTLKVKINGVEDAAAAFKIEPKGNRTVVVGRPAGLATLPDARPLQVTLLLGGREADPVALRPLRLRHRHGRAHRPRGHPRLLPRHRQGLEHGRGQARDLSGNPVVAAQGAPANSFFQARIYAPGIPDSDDPVMQVSVSVIGEGLIQLRGPIKGINVVRIMINQIDAPVGQVRVAMHTMQVNGERGDRMEKVVANIQRYLDHSRFLTTQSAQMLRRSVGVVASRKAEEAALTLAPGCTPADRDQRYLYSYFGKELTDELALLASEFLKTGNKLLSLHSTDTTSLAASLFVLSLARNDVRMEIMQEFARLLQTELPEMENQYYLAGMSGTATSATPASTGGCTCCRRSPSSCRSTGSSTPRGPRPTP